MVYFSPGDLKKKKKTLKSEKKYQEPSQAANIADTKILVKLY